MTYREQLEALIEAAIAALDELDGDENLEDDGSAEPWLGWTRHGGIGNALDLEISITELEGPTHAA